MLPASGRLAGGTAEAHPDRLRVSLFSFPLGGLRWVLWCGNNAHDPAGLDVPEHFREPEILGQDNHDGLF